MANTDGVPLAPDHGILRAWLRFLLGDADAIRRLAATPRLWLVGLLLAFSAGLAREYDAEYLLAEPWHLLIAPGASLIAATVLWLLVQLCGLGHWRKPVPDEPLPVTAGHRQRQARGAYWAPESYLPFLGLFWLTAPLAWLYGIPYERFLSPYDAALANLWTFKLVAAWRVALMVRVLCVLWGVPWWLATSAVLLFADAALLAAMAWLPVPIISFMGGIRLDPAAELIASNAFAAQVLGTLGLLPLICMWLASLAKRGGHWNSRPEGRPLRLRGLAVLGGLFALGWACCLPITQPEQRLRLRIDQAIVQGDYATGLALLARHFPHDTPPHWDPPPRMDYPNPAPDALDVLLAMEAATPGPVREAYEAKLFRHENWWGQSDARFQKLVTLIERQQNANRLMDHFCELFQDRLKESTPSTPLSPELKARIQALLACYPEPDQRTESKP